jgi:hypothetical protein
MKSESTEPTAGVRRTRSRPSASPPQVVPSPVTSDPRFELRARVYRKTERTYLALIRGIDPDDESKVLMSVGDASHHWVEAAGSVLRSKIETGFPLQLGVYSESDLPTVREARAMAKERAQEEDKYAESSWQELTDARRERRVMSRSPSDQPPAVPEPGDDSSRLM